MYTPIKLHREADFDWFKILEKQVLLKAVFHRYYDNDNIPERMKDKILEYRSLYMKLRSDLKIKSGNWVTCACGSLCNVIPNRYGVKSEGPLDERLYQLGSLFHRNVSDEEWNEAMWTLEAIEIRAMELISAIYFGRIILNNHENKYVGV